MFAPSASHVLEVWGAKRVGIRILSGTTKPGKTPLDSQVVQTFDTFVDGLSAIGLLYIHDIEGVPAPIRRQGTLRQSSRFSDPGRAPAETEKNHACVMLAR